MPRAKKPLAYRRILLKLSGEALLGEHRSFGIDRTVTEYLAFLAGHFQIRFDTS